MKSSIKIDTTIDGQPQIAVHVSNDWNDLRDKTLNMFIAGLQPHGRLCFIDSSGSKNSGSSGGDDSMSSYFIKPIKPEHYELLLDEIKILIQERNGFYDKNAFGSDKNHSTYNKEKLDAMSEFEIRAAMNY